MTHDAMATKTIRTSLDLIPRTAVATPTTAAATLEVVRIDRGTLDGSAKNRGDRDFTLIIDHLIGR